MNTTYRSTALALTLALASSPPAGANDKLEEIVVTSSRVAMPLRQLGTSLSVITEEEIRALGFVTLNDVLRTQPAVGVSNYGGAGKASTLRIRGEEGYRTLVLMDGINISDTSGPQFGPRMEQILSSGVARVEVLRGPQGLMYGADAGGVVSISSAAPQQGFAGNVSAEAGRYGTRQLAANLGVGGEHLDGILAVTDLDTDGFNASAGDTDPADDDGYENTTAHGRLGWKVGDRVRLELVGRDVQGDNEYDGCFNALFLPSNDCRDEFEQQAWRTGLSYRGDTLVHELAYSASETERTFFSEAVESFDTAGELKKWSYLGSFTGSEALRLVYGVDLQTDSRTDDGTTQKRDQDGYYLEYQGNFNDRFYLTAGARHDDNEDFGEYTSWRVSGAHLIQVRAGEVKLRGTYGTGFRAPSLYEIAYNRAPWALPPASTTSLDAEKSKGFDLAVSWYADSGLYLEAVYFDQTISDEIYWDSAAGSGYLQAGGDTESRGVELIAEWPLAATLSLTGNYTYNDAQLDNGEQRFYRPEHQANIGLTWLTFDGRLALGASVRTSRDAIDTEGRPTDDYELVNVHASFLVLPGLDVYGRIENLLDEDYEEIPTYNTSGQAAYAGLRYSF